MERTELIAEVMQRVGSIKRLMHGQHYGFDNGLLLSSAQIGVLFAIKHHGPVSSHTLAERLSMTPGGVSQLIEKLTEDNLVAKTAVEGDRRSFSLTLTQKGAALTGRLLGKRDAIIKQSTTDFSDNELALFIRMLDKIAIALQEKSTSTEEK